MKSGRITTFTAALATALLLIPATARSQEQRNRDQQNPEARSQENARNPESARPEQGRAIRRSKGQ